MWICIADAKRMGTVYFCGLVTVNILNTYQDDSLILDSQDFLIADIRKILKEG